MINYLRMININKRKCCVICESDNLLELFTLNMPSYMGVLDEVVLNDIHKMEFVNCNNCGNVQISNILPPELVYRENHNINVVGNIWKKHYEDFSNFISQYISNKIVFEISDPSAKIAKKIAKHSKEWYIIEPNAYQESFENVYFINDFFDVDFKTDKNIQIIVHSHFFEHTENPKKFLETCYNLLTDEGQMFMSIPNLEYLLFNNASPNAILHFEHTFYYNRKILENLLAISGFKILDTYDCGSHSLFFRLVKAKKKRKIFSYFNSGIYFLHNRNIHTDRINKINEELNDIGNIFLYGSHVTSQYYIFNGLKIDMIKSILDNSESKQGKVLYGTRFQVQSPTIIENIDNPIVICSHMGIYYEEIREQLFKLNKNIKYL